MSYIKSIYLRDDLKIRIEYLNTDVWFDLSVNNFGFVVYRNRLSAAEPLSQFSKDNLLGYQYVLFNAYVYLYDLLEDGIKIISAKKT